MPLKEMQFAGDYQLENILVHAPTSNGGLDIKNLMLEMNVYQSIFSPTLTGALTIADSANHLQNVPFIGQEELEFKFGIPDNDLVNFTKHRARVTKISNVTRTEERQQVYTINFTTKEFVKNLRNKLTKSYKGAADQIITEILNDTLTTRKNIKAEATRQRLQLLGNNMSPFDFCSMVARRSSSRDFKSSGLLFYESHFGYNLRSFGALSTQGEKIEYFVNPTDDRVTNRDIQKILEYKVMKTQDVLAHIKTGLLGSTHYTYDINEKRYSTKTQKYFDSFTDTPFHTDRKPIYSQTPEDESGKRIDDFDKASISYSTSSPYLFTTSATDTTDYSNTSNLTPDRIYTSLSNDAFTVKCTVPGNSVLGAGDVVILNLPSLDPIPKNTPNSKVYDRYLSGRYILTNVVHTLSPTSYSTTFDCVKDSVPINYLSSTTPREVIGRL